MTLKEAIMREIDDLPEPRQIDVLSFVRFLKIGLADAPTVERRFVEALAQARALAAERGLTPQDIETEIRAVRAGA